MSELISSQDRGVNTLGIMQPYFLPYCGYWQLMAYCDHWVIFDVVKYNKRSWMNRNRVLHPDSSKPFQYIHLPVKSHKRGEKINKIIINNDKNWCHSLKGKLSFYKRMRAPHYEEVIAMIDSIGMIDDDCFSRFLAKHFEVLMRKIGLKFSYSFASDLDISLEKIEHADDWALQIASHLKVGVYVNPHGGIGLFNEEKYTKNGIALKFLKPHLSYYSQGKREIFTSSLSIIDFLMFNSPEATRDMLIHDFDLINKQRSDRNC